MSLGTISGSDTQPMSIILFKRTTLNIKLQLWFIFQREVKLLKKLKYHPKAKKIPTMLEMRKGRVSK